jgi:predicted nucleotidyltransferase
MLSWGPKALPHKQRMAIAQEIAERLKERFHPEVVAIGLYGSLAREEDGPFSDIELFGVMQANHYEQRYEWCTATDSILSVRCQRTGTHDVDPNCKASWLARHSLRTVRSSFRRYSGSAS